MQERSLWLGERLLKPLLATWMIGLSLAVLYLFRQDPIAEDTDTLYSQISEEKGNFCRGLNNSRGVWERTAKPVFLPCCGWQDHSIDTPGGFCGEFNPEEENTYRGDRGGVPLPGADECRCGLLSTLDLYRFKPEHCALRDWDAELFCRVLGNRTLVLIGDSTMGQWASTLMNRITMDLGMAGCQYNVIYEMSDTLVGRAFGWFNRGLSWTDIVRKRNPDVVILSAGPHVTAGVGTPGFLEIVEQVSREHRELFPQLPVIWRSQPAAGCGERTFHERLEVEPFRERSKTDEMYNYRFFVEWDEIARGAFDRFLDISPLYARIPDKPAGDCMHFCTGALASFVAETLQSLILDLFDN